MLKVIGRVLQLSGDLAGRIWGSFACSFIDAALSMLPIGALFYVLLALQQGAVTAHTWLVAVLIILGSLLGRMLFKYLVYRLQSTAGFEFVSRERITLGDRLRNVPMGFFHDNSLGEITATVTTDLNFLENYSMHIMDKVAAGVVSMAVISLFLLLFDWRIGAIFLAGVLCSFLIYGVMQKKAKELSVKQKQAQAGAVASTLEYIQGISVVKSFNMSQKNLSGIEGAFRKSESAAFSLEKAFAPLNMAYSSVFHVAACLIMLCAQLIALGGALTFPELAAVLVASFTIFAPVEAMGQMTQMIRLMEASLGRVEAMKRARRIDEDGGDVPLRHFDISFEHVAFSYEPGAPLLKDVTFHIPEGSMTAIVGPSGSGKTTITRLIARFWDVQNGSVKVGGHDVREFTCDSLLKNMSMVFQNVYLFHDTIENNIKFGCPEATHEQVVEAAKKACCHDFIAALPNGYDTVIGEGGSTLSGGERQRVSIARAMLKDAPIILLDEATASVDPENELHLQQAISALVRNKTLVVIAHRLSTIREADQILVVDNGRIVQQGTHEELAGQKGLYQSFWNIRQRARQWRLER